MRGFLLRRRIRIHLVSGVEYEMLVFIVGPLTRELRKGHWVRSAHPASERVRTEVPA